MNIKNKSQFIEYFSKGIKDLNKLKIGVEHERFLFENKNKKRISYETLKKLFENLENNSLDNIKNIILSSDNYINIENYKIINQENDCYYVSSRS